VPRGQVGLLLKSSTQAILVAQIVPILVGLSPLVNNYLTYLTFSLPASKIKKPIRWTIFISLEFLKKWGYLKSR